MEGRKLASTIISVSCKTLLVVLFSLLLIFVGKKVYNFGKDVFSTGAKDTKDNAISISFEIPEDWTNASIAKRLAEAGIVDNAKIFETQIKLSHFDGKFVPGIYEISSAMTPTELMEIFSPEPVTETEKETQTKTVTETTVQG